MSNLSSSHNAIYKLEFLILGWQMQLGIFERAGFWPERQTQLKQHIRTAEKLRNRYSVELQLACLK